MLSILATHPIQYQVPLWQALARDGRVPFEVWYLSDHAIQASRDREFGREFAWDLNMLEGYPYRFLQTPIGATPNMPLRSRISGSLPHLFKTTKTTALWVQGWQVAAYWQAAWAAHQAGIQVWLRGESNNLAPRPPWKQIPKRVLLGELFRRVDQFLCIGTANRELYRSFGVTESKLHMARYAVDNDRFARQANQIRKSELDIRKEWGIPADAFCVLFCGKFILKKRPLDLIAAARLLLEKHPNVDIHLLFVGSGELGAKMRMACDVVFDAEQQTAIHNQPSAMPRASFTGFLNQTEISKAYAAADLMVLPSDYSETWGLVVNEAMASGLPCLVSDHCGCAQDLGVLPGNAVFRFGDVRELSEFIAGKISEPSNAIVSKPPSLSETVEMVQSLYVKE